MTSLEFDEITNSAMALVNKMTPDTVGGYRRGGIKAEGQTPTSGGSKGVTPKSAPALDASEFIDASQCELRVLIIFIFSHW